MMLCKEARQAHTLTRYSMHNSTRQQHTIASPMAHVRHLAAEIPINTRASAMARKRLWHLSSHFASCRSRPAKCAHCILSLTVAVLSANDFPDISKAVWSCLSQVGNKAVKWEVQVENKSVNWKILETSGLQVEHVCHGFYYGLQKRHLPGRV